MQPGERLQSLLKHPEMPCSPFPAPTATETAFCSRGSACQQQQHPLWRTHRNACPAEHPAGLKRIQAHCTAAKELTTCSSLLGHCRLRAYEGIPAEFSGSLLGCVVGSTIAAELSSPELLCRSKPI